MSQENVEVVRSVLQAFNRGDWDAVFAVIKKCHETVHEMGAPRITTSIRLGTRVDRKQTMADKVDSVERKLSIKP